MYSQKNKKTQTFNQAMRPASLTQPETKVVRFNLIKYIKEKSPKRLLTEPVK